MSDMARARELMIRSRAKMQQAMELIEEADALSRQAQALTVRASPVRRAPNVAGVHPDDVRADVIDLAENYRHMTQHQIADAVGLNNAGRVSEILTGKR